MGAGAPWRDGTLRGFAFPLADAARARKADEGRESAPARFAGDNLLSFA